MNSYTGQRFKLITTLIAAVLFVFLSTANVSASSGLTLSRTSATIEIGKTLQLTAYQNGKAVPGAVWGSSDPSVAAVSGSGQVTAAAKGSAVIKAVYNGAETECLVSVVKKTKSKTVRYNVLIIDRSGSMRGTPMARVKKAANRFAKTVLSADGTNYVAVVTLGSKAETSCKFTTSYKKVKKAINGMKAKGHTNMQAAFKKAFSLMKKAPAGKKVIKNVILCSDGLPEKGVKQTKGKYSKSDHKYYKYANAVYKVDKQMKNKGYFIYALGFFHNSSGKNLKFGKRLMKDLASKDKYHIIKKSEDVDDAFDDIAKKITSEDPGDSPVPPSAIEFGNHHYKRFDKPMTWEEAKKYCEKLGGHLVTITSEEEQEFVKEYIVPGKKNYYWMGAKRDESYHFSKWVTGESITYTHFDSGEPNNYMGTENVLVMYRIPNPRGGSDGYLKWNDLSETGYCNGEEFFGKENSGFICEWDE